MTLSNEKRRERYRNDEDYRNKILKRSKMKYHNDIIYREKKINQSLEYSKTHRCDKHIYLKQYYINNSDRIKKTSRTNQLNDRYEVLYWYSNGLMECECCGESYVEFLCIDHINDNGSEHRKELGKGGNRIYRYILNNNFPDGYQVLCNNCNYLKEYLSVQCKPKSNTKYAVAIRKQRSNIRLQTLYWYSSGRMECDCCGENDLRFLTIDHINGRGKQHLIKNNINNLYEYLYYNNFPEGYRVLCWNCNKSYGQYGYCPHDENIL